jgi:hypothetical protein
MQRITGRREPLAGEAERGGATKRQIFEKVSKRMDELATHLSPVCAELNPDVIVISDDQSFLFEPQNLRVTEWLHLHFGLDNLRVRERIRVHPVQAEIITSELKAAGFEVIR